MQTIGAYDAKTQLPRLLDKVAQGETITITKHGLPVAMLVPVPAGRQKSTRDVIDALKEVRRGKTLGGVKTTILSRQDGATNAIRTRPVGRDGVVL